MFKFNNLSPEFKELYTKMEKVIGILEKDFSGLRTGRVSVHLIDKVNVDAHGAKIPLQSLSNISVSNNQTLLVKVWDKSLVKKVDKAIIDARLGVTTSIEDDVVIVRIPVLSEDRRKEICKIALKYAEKIRITLRSLRKEYTDLLKSQEKEKVISKDEFFNHSKVLQNILDFFISKVDQKLKQKTQEIMNI